MIREIIRRNNVISDVMQAAFSSSKILLHFYKYHTHFFGTCNPKKAAKMEGRKFHFGRQIGYLITKPIPIDQKTSLSMKDCCKNADDNKKKGFAKWLQYAVYLVIAAIVIGALILQILQ